MRAGKALYLVPNAELGGAEKATLLIMRLHDRGRYEPVALFFAGGPLVDETRAMGVRTYVLEGRVRLRNPLSLLSASNRIRRLVAEEGIDLLHCCLTYAHAAIAPYALAGAKPVCVFQHGPVGSWIDRLSAALPARHVFANSRFTLEAHRRYHPRGETSVLYIDSGETPSAESRRERRREVEAEFRLRERDVVLAIVGRFDPWKGFDLTLEAAAPLLRRNPEAKLMIVGGPFRHFHPEYEGILRRIVEREAIGEKVIFTGFRPDAGRLLARADVLIQASKSEAGFGLTVVEAMKLGVAVVATRSCDEIIRDGESGLLYPAGSVEALRERIERVAADESLRRRIGLAGQGSVRTQFAAEAMIRQIEDTYDRMRA